MNKRQDYFKTCKWPAMMMCSVLFIALLSLHGKSAHAQTGAFQSFEFFDSYFDADALGQGNAFTAIAKRHSALYYNPANLEANEKFRLANLFQGEFSPGVVKDAVNAFSSIADIFDTSVSQADKLQQTQAALNPLRLKNAHLRLNVGSLATWKGWGAGLNIRAANLDTSIGPDATETYVRLLADASLILGKSHSFLEDKLWVGLVSRWTYRLSLNRSYTVEQLLNDSKAIENIFSGGSISEGLLLDLDFGTTYFLPLWEDYKPRVSFVLAHIGDQFFLTSFKFLKGSKGQTDLVKEQMRAHFGYGMEFPKFLVFVPTLSVDVRNVGLSNGDLFKHLHIGTSWRAQFSDAFGGEFRTGISQGYLTAGISGYIWWFNLDAAYYVEEIGARTGQNPDRRLVLRLTFEIS